MKTSFDSQRSSRVEYEEEEFKSAINTEVNEVGQMLETEVFVTKWQVDSTLNSLIFQLSDQSVGSFFDDSTEIVSENGVSSFYYYEKPKT